MTSKANEQKALDLKEQGNTCIKEKKYAEAMIHYTHALKLDPKNPQIYSNRSLAFLKLFQYYYALQDANETIQLKPNWAKGYFRRGEVEYAAQQYESALASYKKALTLDSEDSTIKEAIKRSSSELDKTKSAEMRLPWLGLGLGLLMGVFIVVGDELATKQPSLNTFVLKILIVLATSAVGLGISRAYGHYIKIHRDSLIEKPLDLFGEDENKPNETQELSKKEKSKNSTHGSRSAGLARKRAAARNAS